MRTTDDSEHLHKVSAWFVPASAVFETPGVRHVSGIKCVLSGRLHLPEMRKAWLVADKIGQSKGSMARSIHANVVGDGWVGCCCVDGALVLLSLSSRQMDGCGHGKKYPEVEPVSCVSHMYVSVMQSATALYQLGTAYSNILPHD